MHHNLLHLVKKKRGRGYKLFVRYSGIIVESTSSNWHPLSLLYTNESNNFVFA